MTRSHFLFLLTFIVVTKGAHLNGGSIRWVPVDPYDNSSSITIDIIQSYSWVYPLINCLNDVPISTPSRLNSNLMCVAQCPTDGGYSAAPIDILTDCISSSSPLRMMTSKKSKAVTLTANASFSIAHRGTSWIGLNNLPSASLDWSFVASIDLRKRPDGFINTPPLANVISPQYAVANKTLEIKIHVSDVNAGDDIRCRWARDATNGSADECGGVCYPTTLPINTTLSNCTVTFISSQTSIWYAAAIQVEDFINETSNVPMSSVPIQFLIHAIPQPICTEHPIIVPLSDCLEVTVGVLTKFNISVINSCPSNVASIIDLLVTDGSAGMQLSDLTNSTANSSIFYKTLSWTPSLEEMGLNQLCLVAYTRKVSCLHE